MSNEALLEKAGDLILAHIAQLQKEIEAVIYDRKHHDIAEALRVFASDAVKEMADDICS
jgi:orotidine-5'-phosphate decarboxylase